MCILGHYLLFAPIINLLNMIPFVGWLLSSIVAVAAIIHVTFNSKDLSRSLWGAFVQSMVLQMLLQMLLDKSIFFWSLWV